MYSKKQTPSYNYSNNKSTSTTSTTTTIKSHHHDKEPIENTKPITPSGVYLYNEDYTHFCVNCKTSKDYDVYVGRKNPTIKSTVSTKWGNPFKVGPDGDRNAVMKKYRDWIFSPAQDDLFQCAKTELKGKILACWCKPYNCHSFILAEIANSSISNKSPVVDVQVASSSPSTSTTTTTTSTASTSPSVKPPTPTMAQLLQSQPKTNNIIVAKPSPVIESDNDFPILGKMITKKK
ncbi:hypothetical protein CYY_003779 [Polysphondylium violaceum]|uniref:DUF4326 domain-containing protein n=1 Tax=Polysphondylium violaceum TaxID=133409 RepID=A0A8J4PWA0_9MYCE|nr:hypothetical protein CYY_003779 [Polysphondylium violaceum]